MGDLREGWVVDDRYILKISPTLVTLKLFHILLILSIFFLVLKEVLIPICCTQFPFNICAHFSPLILATYHT